MVLGFETAKRTPLSVSPLSSRTVPAPDLDLDSDPAAALDDGHTGRAHNILSHVTIPTTGIESPRAQNNMITQDGEVEGRPPYSHVGRTSPVPVTICTAADRTANL